MKKPKFFCESCGSEVKQNDKICTHCGKFFASVKCPSCGFSGESRSFRDGCPACGYAVPLGNGSHGRKDNRGMFRQGADKETDPLPWWIYAATLALAAVLIILIILRK